MSPQEEKAVVDRQEAMLVLERFGLEDAWTLGLQLRNTAAARQAPVAIAITLNQQRVFFCMLPGATPGNDDWARRKHNAVYRFQQSSYGVGLDCRIKGRSLETRTGLPAAELADHGGGFPIRLKGTGCIGSVVVSGLPQREDHQMVADALAWLAGIDDLPSLTG